MRAMFATLWMALALCGATAFAQSAGSNGCDGTNINACETIAAYYEHGSPPFPKDPDRAQRLRATVMAEGWAACRAGDVAQCFKSVNLVQKQAQSSGADNPVEATLLLLQTTAQTCAKSKADGCYWQARGLQKMGSARPEKPTHTKLMALAQAEAETIADLQGRCDDGHGQVCTLLATRILKPETIHAFLAIAEKACGTSDAIGCSAYGMTQLGAYREPPNTETLTKAAAALTKTCKADALRACHAI